MKIMLYNITQIYTQLKIKFNHIVIYHLFMKLKKRYPKNTILRIVKLLSSITKAKNYLFIIYLDYHKRKLDMKI